MSGRAATPTLADLRSREIEQERRLLATIERGLPTDPWSAASAAASNGVAEAVPGMLYRLWRSGEISDEQLPDAVAWTWIYNKSPLSGLGERRWLGLFKAAIQIVKAAGDAGCLIAGAAETWLGDELVPIEYEHLTEMPTEPLSAWRGAALVSKGRGMSWSVHRECARDFAQGWANTYGTPTGLFRATVPPRAVLALFGDWREQEVVVNPNMLRGRIELVEEVPPSQESLDHAERIRAAFGAER